MKTLLRCKACGYIMDASALKELCPACGVPASQLEAYDDRVKEGRRRLLDLHIHPVIVHAPQAFALALIILPPVILALGRGEVAGLCRDTARVLGVALPFTVLAAFLSGLFDGKLRFRKTNTPLLMLKKILGLLFFASSLGLGALAFSSPLDATSNLLAFEGLGILGMGCGAWLGLIGTPLGIAKFPG